MKSEESPNKRIKILYLMRLLTEKSDAEHPLSMSFILSYLGERGIKATRKTIYEDIALLRDFGLDISMTKAVPGCGYFIASRDFETPELKLLVDSVHSSQFITEKKSSELIKKLEALTSEYEATLLSRNVYVKNRVKSMNESIYYNVDSIHEGITKDKQISFLYFEYDVNKQKQYRKDKTRYVVSPFALTWDAEHYYLIAYDADAEKIKHFRVDRMESIWTTEDDREGHLVFGRYDMSIYTRQAFSMYGGTTESVCMEFENSLVNVVIDRFGKDVVFIRQDDDHFRVVTNVMVSPQFYAWIFGLTPQARIVSPDSVIQGMKEMLGQSSELYR